jgi:hypothetical protein
VPTCTTACSRGDVHMTYTGTAIVVRLTRVAVQQAACELVCQLPRGHLMQQSFAWCTTQIAVSVMRMQPLGCYCCSAGLKCSKASQCTRHCTGGSVALSIVAWSASMGRVCIIRY